jgi:hypothetical protein
MRRTRKRKPKTVISPRPLQPFRRLGFAFPASRRALLSLFLLLLCFKRSVPAAGNPSPSENRHNQPYALIFGTVWGPGDQPLYGVKVKVRRQNEKKARWQLYTDHHGEFALRVPAGKQDYVVWADLKNYQSSDGKPLHSGEITVHVEYDERVDTGLHLN